MSRRLVPLTIDNLHDLPGGCRSCVFWELDAVASERAADTGDVALEKEAWVSDTLLEWGCCGQLLYVDGRPAGYALFAPPAYVPRSAAFATSPVAPDAVLLMTAWVTPDSRGGGLGRVLVQGVARDIVRRGIRAVEAFGHEGTDRGRGGDRSGAASGCLLPAGFLRAVGFKTVRPHPRTPRMRLDVKSTATWRQDAGSALERLVSSIHAPALSR